MKKRNMLKYICYMIYILSPIILLLFLSFICNRNAFSGKPIPYYIWNDEVGYWREIFSFAEHGFNTGYIGINEAIPKIGQFSTHGFFPAFFYYPFAKILGWPNNAIVISNLMFMIICFTLVVIFYAICILIGIYRIRRDRRAGIGADVEPDETEIPSDNV